MIKLTQHKPQPPKSLAQYLRELEAGRWIVFPDSPTECWGLCARCYSLKPAFHLYLVIRPFGKGEEWRCEECGGTRVKTN